MTKKGAVDDFLSVVNIQKPHQHISTGYYPGQRNEDVSCRLPVGLHDHGHQLEGHGRDIVHPEGKVGDSP